MGLSPYHHYYNERTFDLILGDIQTIIIIFLNFFRSILGMASIPVSSEYDLMVPLTDYHENRLPRPKTTTFMEQFRKQVPAIRFGSAHNYKDFQQECRVCLTRFRCHSVINNLCCGHVFHTACLEKWLDGHWKTTCPTCRTRVLSEEEEEEEEEELPPM